MSAKVIICQGYYMDYQTCGAASQPASHHFNVTNILKDNISISQKENAKTRISKKSGQK